MNDSKLSPTMNKLLGIVTEPGKVYTVSSVEVRFYGHPKGSHGYVNKGRGASLTSTFKALERRGILVREGGGWRLWQKGDPRR